MDIRKRTISDIIHKEYKNYALYVLYNRAIPCMIDGMKPVQRKIFYVMLKQKELMKVSAIAGAVIQNANYHHGDGSCASAVVGMTQDFPGSNNIPWLKGKGAFGTQLIPDGVAAPRYIYSKLNPIITSIYQDFEICPKNSDLENPEPEFYLPIIPMILVNGARGIAVGFATEIQQRNPIDIIDNIKSYLNGGQITPMTPYFHGYTGLIDLCDDGFHMYGTFEITEDNEAIVTEVPINWNREQYLDYLNKMEERGNIKSYDDRSKEGWNIIVKCFNKTNLESEGWQLLKLDSKLSENITVIDETGNLKIYKKAEDLLQDFVEFRLKMYQKRIEYKIQILTDDIALNLKKIEFIKYFDKIKSLTKDELVKFLRTKNYTQKQIAHCIGLPIYRFTKDEIEKTEKDIKSLESDLEYYKKTSNRELYHKDLTELRMQLIKAGYKKKDEQE